MADAEQGAQGGSRAKLRNSTTVFLVGNIEPTMECYKLVGFKSKYYPPGFAILSRRRDSDFPATAAVSLIRRSDQTVARQQFRPILSWGLLEQHGNYVSPCPVLPGSNFPVRSPSGWGRRFSPPLASDDVFINNLRSVRCVAEHTRTPVRGAVNWIVGCRTTLLLVRHAQSDCSQNGSALLCGSHDTPLSIAGQEQVERLRDRLARETAACALYSSPLRRALDTAAAAPAALQQKCRVVRSIQEIHCGSVEGWPLTRVQTTYFDYWQRNLMQADDDFRWPGGESYSCFRRRVLRAVRTIARYHVNEQVILFTHAGVINQVLGWMAGQNAARWENFRPGYASITSVTCDGSSWLLESFDDRSHLL